MIKIAVVDNSDSAKETLKQFLDKYAKKHELSFYTDCFQNGEDLLKNYHPVYNLIFLDIEMPKKDGMETAREIRKIDSNVTIVFVTRMAQYAVNGYEVNALDYLVKPFSYSAFEFRMDRILKHLQNHDEKYILLNSSEGVRKIPVSHLVYVEVIKHKLLYHTEDDIYETSASMKQAETQLKAYGFERCDNSFLVNLKFVTWAGTKELIAGGNTIKFSRPRRKAFMQALADYIGGNI